MLKNNSMSAAAVARNLKSSRWLKRVDVIAYVEDKEDIVFWQHAIGYSRPGKKISFMPGDCTGDATHTGKTVCMRYVPYLDSHFIICVDSDFDCFLTPGSLSAGKYILQTYTYSWENHYCQMQNLQKSWSVCKLGFFNFVRFITALNGILYPVLIGMLSSKKKDNKLWSLDVLCSEILKVQPNSQELLADDGKELIAAIKVNVESWAKLQTPVSAEDYSAMVACAASAGLTQDTAYLYMQGHCIFNLLRRIGNFLSNGQLDFRYQVMDSALSFTGYPQIDALSADVKTIM